MVTITISLRPRCGHEEFHAQCVYCANLLIAANRVIRFVDDLKAVHGNIEAYHNTWTYENSAGQEEKQP